MGPEPLVSLPVAVIMEKRQVSRGRWSVPSWQAVAVVAGEKVAAATARQRSLARSGPDFEQYLWGGFAVHLHKDGAEDYWFNLTGGRPALFVMCHESPDGELEPVVVTANPVEASGAVESDAEVFAVPIPPEMYKHIEEFVVNHYVPEERGKRKRKDWMEDLDRG